MKATPETFAAAVFANQADRVRLMIAYFALIGAPDWLNRYALQCLEQELGGANREVGTVLAEYLGPRTASMLYRQAARRRFHNGDLDLCRHLMEECPQGTERGCYIIEQTADAGGGVEHRVFRGIANAPVKAARHSPILCFSEGPVARFNGCGQFMGFASPVTSILRRDMVRRFGGTLEDLLLKLLRGELGRPMGYGDGQITFMT